jgi:cell wall-associated NlpC family hydrolase
VARLVRLAKLVALAFAVAATVALAPVRPSEPAPSQPQIAALTAPAVAIKSSDAAPAVHRILPTGSEPKPAAAQRAGSKAVWAALTRLGSPYVWAAAGPDAFDCSGLVLYAFAGVGIKLPHYSGSQYNMGRKIPTALMRRGDVVFYGPNASQHVAIFLGNGQMIEAPYTGSVVKISPLRTSGMTPFAVRYVEF